MRCFTMFLVLALSCVVNAQEFSAKSIDLGIVVADLEKSADFYKNAIGMKEVPGFSVPANWCKDVGLTDGHSLAIRVMVLGEGAGASKIKLMQLPGVKSEKPDNKHIHSSFGFSYITIGVTDADAAHAKLVKAGAKTVTKSPVSLPTPLPSHIFLTVVRDPDGNLIELVGPKK